VVKQEEITVMETEARIVYEDFVKWRKKGDTKTECVYKIRVLQKHDPEAWGVIKPFYEAWKKGEEAPQQGLPLANWALMKKPMLEKLKQRSIYTVEDFAKLEDSSLGEIGPEARKLRDQARNMVSMNANMAQFVAASQKRDEEMAEQNKRIEELTAQIAAMGGGRSVDQTKGGKRT